MDKYIINAPIGTRDMIGEDCEKRKKVEDIFYNLCTSRGYTQVITSSLEYFDMYSNDLSVRQENMYKLTDRNGKILVMRPDMTTPIARIAATRFAGSQMPLKLFYLSNVFRVAYDNRGESAEIMQGGIELLGDSSIQADLQVITDAIDMLLTCGISDFQLEIGHTGYFKQLTAGLGLTDPEIDALHNIIEQKDYAALMDFAAGYSSSPYYGALIKLSQMFGGQEILDQAYSLTPESDDKTALDYLQSLYKLLVGKGYGDYISIDLGIVSKLDYYTGVIFRAYTPGVGKTVLTGGRYDKLAAVFGADISAVGFAMDIDAVAFCEKDYQKTKKNLRLAVTKGRIESKTLEFLESMGADCTEIRQKSRKLIYSFDNIGIDLVLAKAVDVITYIESGVCDLGIVGKDTIMENGSSFYEVLDLGFGKCRFALATFKDSDFYENNKAKTIATKYPKITRNFFAGKGMDVDIIKIDGSVELAPVLGLADGIVDIVETGKTLAENGLVTIEDIAPISARLIVNVASMKTQKDKVLEFVNGIAKQI